MQRFLSLLRLVPPGTGAAARRNGALPPVTGYITDQRALPDYRLGRGKFALTGCEAAAVYNVLRFLGRDVGLPELIEEFIARRALMLLGLGGADPFAIAPVLTAHGLEYRFYGERQSWPDFRDAAAARQARAYIVSYWNGRFHIHTVALLPQADGTLRVLNGAAVRCLDAEGAAPEMAARFLAGYEIL